MLSNFLETIFASMIRPIMNLRIIGDIMMTLYIVRSPGWTPKSSLNIYWMVCVPKNSITPSLKSVNVVKISSECSWYFSNLLTSDSFLESPFNVDIYAPSAYNQILGINNLYLSKLTKTYIIWPLSSLCGDLLIILFQYLRH